MRLIVYYEGFESNSSTLDFDAILYDPCLTASITVSEDIVPSQAIPYEQQEIDFDSSQVSVSTPVETC